MAYQTVRALKLPIGSGAIESAIRRVVNGRSYTIFPVNAYEAEARRITRF